MTQNDSYNKSERQEKEDWLNEHGQPDFEYLHSLAINGSPEALEKLESIAEDLDVEHDPDTPPEELISRIRSATARNEDGGSNAIT